MNLSIQAYKKKNGDTSDDQKKPGKRGKSPNFKAFTCPIEENSGTGLVQFVQINRKDD